MGDADKGAAVSYIYINFCFFYKILLNILKIVIRYLKPNVLNVTRSKQGANTKLDPTCTVYSDVKPGKLLVSLIPMPTNKKVNCFYLFVYQ